MVRALAHQSIGCVLKTSRWLNGCLSLSFLPGRSNSIKIMISWGVVIKGKLSSGIGLSALNQLSAIHKKEPESFFKFKGIKKTFEIELTIIVFTVSFTTLPNFYP